MNRPDLDALQALVDQAHPDNATDAQRWADVLGACAQALRSLPELIAYVRQLERDEVHDLEVELTRARAEREVVRAADAMALECRRVGLISSTWLEDYDDARAKVKP